MKEKQLNADREPSDTDVVQASMKLRANLARQKEITDRTSIGNITANEYEYHEVQHG